MRLDSARPIVRARLVWGAVEQLDLSSFHDAIDAREGTAGQPATDPAILLALWVFATSEGIGSARHLERLSQPQRGANA